MTKSADAISEYQPRILRDIDPNYWVVVRTNGKTVGGFKSKEDAQRFIDCGGATL